jgi:hypothetical protein
MSGDQNNLPFFPGALKETYGPNTANVKVILYTMPVFIIVGFIFIFSIPIAGIIFFLIAAGCIVGWRMQLRAKAEVYERGLVATDWLGRKSAFQWEEVEGIYEMISYHQRRYYVTGWVYTVLLTDGRKVKLDMAYEKVRNLGWTVISTIGKELLPRALKRIEEGETVFFGNALGINKQGVVKDGGDLLPWEQVDKIEIGKFNNVVIRKKGQFAPWKLAMHQHIANYPTFHTLLHETVRGTPAEEVVEDPRYERQQELQQPHPVANIGTVSAAINYDVRDLLMEGFTMEEIQRVFRKELTLEELKRLGPGSRPTK